MKNILIALVIALSGCSAMNDTFSTTDLQGNKHPWFTDRDGEPMHHFNSYPGINNMEVMPNFPHAHEYAVRYDVVETCPAVQQEFDKLLLAAQWMVPTDQRSGLKSITLHVVNFKNPDSSASQEVKDELDKDNLWGYAKIEDKEVLISTKVCAFDNVVSTAIIAHEIGHHQSYIRNPELMVERNNTSGVSFNINKQTFENYAQIAGAQIAKRAGYDTEGYLTFTQNLCDIGNKYQCEFNKYWKIGLAN